MYRQLPRAFPVAVLLLASCERAGTAHAAAGETTQSPSAVTGGSSRRIGTVKIRLVAEGTVLTATLDDNAATRDFVSLLPLSLTLKDYAGTEKVSDLPKRLSTSATPAGVDPDVGDLAYYAPWGNLAIFYRDFGYSSGLVRLGRIDSGIEKLAGKSGSFAVRFELVEEGR
ncbi:hypothetical protein SAMN04488504_11446 [Myxococcus virescens]|uniref:Cyclophilin-like domain-containing protein n=2 Tax=Myxococcus virescens TaxID=83456 RepID=A0ABY0N3C0_9BACT|nr:cyclophilin-like fold protein [Myxococcus virescens]SDE88817.1 hypothetical protein SAMN04488504_11446 [Myxococcus virescens]